MEGDAIAGGAGDASDGGRVVEVAPSRRVRKQEVVAHEVHQDCDVFGRKSHPGRDAQHDLHADRSVVSRVALADVVEQGADEEKVRTLHPIGQAGGIGRRLEQVPVDRIGVIGVALRLVAHGGPLGDEAHEESVLIERFDVVDEGVPQGEQPYQGPAGLGPPRFARIGHDVGQSVEGGLGDGPVELGGGGSEAERQRRVVGDRCQRRQRHFAVDQDHVRPELGAPVGRGLVVALASEATSGRGSGVPEPATTPHVVTHPRDLPTGISHGRHEVVGVGHAERYCDLVLVLQQEPVVRPAGDAMQLDADGGEEIDRV